MTVLATRQKARRPSGQELAAIVARQQQPRKRGTTVEARKAAFSNLQSEIRSLFGSGQRLSAEMALQAGYNYTALKHAQMCERQSKSAVKLWEAMGEIAGRAFTRISDLEKTVAELRGDESHAAATAKTTLAKPLRLSLWRAIDDASVAPLIQRIEAAHGREIKLSIESPGGEIAAAQRVAAAIERHGQIDATAISKCDSAATIVFAACRRRGAMKNASFYFHRPTFDGQPAKTAGDQRRLDRIAKDMSGFIAKRCNGKPATFLRMMGAEGRVVSALEASELGLINATIRRPHVPRKDKSK